MGQIFRFPYCRRAVVISGVWS